MKEGEALPDHLRCNRTDGRQWRCNRRVMEDKKLCEIHYLQGKHRQYKEKVPESLKIQRRSSKSEGKVSVPHNLKIRAQKIEKPGKRSVKLKRKNLARELMRMVVKREVEKRREVEECGGEDMMRRLPNGIMVISNSPSRRQKSSSDGNAGSRCDVKVGIDANVARRRRFRSKNLEPLPIGTVQVLPYKRNAENMKGGRRRCHRCKSSNATSLIKCSSCKRHFFCLECIKEWYFDTQEEVKMECPVCRKSCRCKECMAYQYRDNACQELSSDDSRADKILHSHYLISVLLPVLKEINQDRSIELEVEAKLREMEVSQVEIQQADYGLNKQYCCNYCKSSILDLHRSCSSCSCNLCISCYWDFCRGVLPKGNTLPNNKCGNKRKPSVHGYKQVSEKSISKIDQRTVGRSLAVPKMESTSKACNGNSAISRPPLEFGCCENGRFNLRSFHPLNWCKELERLAEEIVCSYDLRGNLDGNLCCSLCPCEDRRGESNQLQQAASRTSNDNFLYYPTALEVHADKCEHFQKHWSRGHPVIVRDFLWKASDLSWDPIFMFCTYLESILSKHGSDKEACKGSPCLEWCEVEISMKQLFMGSMRGKAQENTGHEILKMKSWFSSRYFREQFPDHYGEIFSALPLQEYMNPDSGCLNLATMLPLENMSAEIGPYVYISYCTPQQGYSRYGSKLSYDFCDVVNILANTTDDSISPDKINRIKKLMRKRQAQDEEESIRTSNDELLADEAKEKMSSLAENSSEAPETIRECMQLRKRMARLSWLSTSSEELPFLVDHNKLSQDQSRHPCDTYAHASLRDVPCSPKSKIQNLSGDQQSQNAYMKKAGESCGAQWDVFRREDVPKLLEYFKRHSNDFMQPYGFQKHVFHPILDQCYFLDEYHKLSLKEEFDIEPWSFEQHVGEAVIIPAGCPYQIRNPKSCVNVVLHFVSPESASECIRLSDELRQLPEDHEARVDKLEVKKMAVKSISRAVEEIRELTCVKDSEEP